MPNQTDISKTTQTAERDCNINVLNLNNYTFYGNNPPSPNFNNNTFSSLACKDSKAYEDLCTFSQDSSLLSKDQVLDIIKLPLLTKEDKEKRESLVEIHIDNDNAFDILNLTNELNDLILKDISEKFIVDNIEKILENDKIPHIKEDLLENIFGKAFENFSTEDLFPQIKNWKDKNSNERRKRFCRLMRLISNKTLEKSGEKFITSDFVDELDNCESCFKISKDIIKKQADEITLLKNKLITIKSKLSRLIRVSVNDVTKRYVEIQIFDPVKFSWSKLAKLNLDIRLSRKFIMNDSLIFFGGKDSHYQCTNETYRFDIKNDKKLPMKFMLTKRSYFACAVLENKLFVMGGCDEKLEVISTVEMWDPIKDDWKSVQKMNKKRHHHAAASLNGTIYVFGGYNYAKDKYCKSFEKYDFQSDVWTIHQIQDDIPRSGSIIWQTVALSLKDTIVLYEPQKKSHDLQPHLKIFHESTENFTFESDVPELQECHDLILYNDKILFIGHAENNYYNLKTNQWSKFQNQEISYPNCIFLFDYY